MWGGRTAWVVGALGPHPSSATSSWTKGKTPDLSNPPWVSVFSCAQWDDNTSSLIKALCENLSESVLKIRKHSTHNRWWYDQIHEGLNMTSSLSFQLWAQICPKYSVVGRWEGRRGGFKYGGMVGANEARHPNILDVFQPQYWLSCTVFWDQKKTCILVKSLFFSLKSMLECLLNTYADYAHIHGKWTDIGLHA